MSADVHVRFCERLGWWFPGATRLSIYVSSERSAQRVYKSISHWLKQHLNLQVNPDKSGIARPWQRRFLGFRIREDGEIGIAPGSLQGYKAKVRQYWDARQSLTSRQLVTQWRIYVRGWWNYFGIAVETLAGLSAWTRRHMRKCFWQRWHNRRGRINRLKQLGISLRLLKRVDFHAGAWRAARHRAMHTALSNRVLRQYHLVTPNDLALS